MKTILFVINSCTKFSDQLIKGTDVVEPQSCRKSRNCRLLAILTILKKFGRVQNLKIYFLKYYIVHFRPLSSITELHRSRDIIYCQILGPTISCF